MPRPLHPHASATIVRQPHQHLVIGLSLALALVLVGQAWSQEGSAPIDQEAEHSTREHFTLKLGSLYEQGDFDTPSTTHVVSAPLTLRYNGEKFDVSATPAFEYIRTSGGVVLIDGTPTPAKGGGQPSPAGDDRLGPAQTWGMGDTVIKSRIFLVEDPGSESPLPAITPFFKVKIPTGNPANNLSTGGTDYGFGVELDKQISTVLLFGDLGYTFIEKVPGLDLRNRPAASLGVGKRASDALTVSAMLDWRRSLVAQASDPLELVGVVSYKPTPTTTISPNFFVGLTNGSSTFGAGIELAFKFGRF